MSRNLCAHVDSALPLMPDQDSCVDPLAPGLCYAPAGKAGSNQHTCAGDCALYAAVQTPLIPEDVTCV
jgi:hypothetical protein